MFRFFLTVLKFYLRTVTNYGRKGWVSLSGVFALGNVTEWMKIGGKCNREKRLHQINLNRF